MRNGDKEKLFSAITSSNTEQVKQLITEDNVNDKNDEGKTPLHEAAKKGNLEIINLLLGLQVQIEAKDEEGKTPLHEAAQYGHYNSAQRLIAARANVNAVDKNGKTPLHKAFKYLRNPKIIELLINSGANIEAKDKEGKTPINSLDVENLDTHKQNLYKYQNIINFLGNFINKADNNTTDKNLALAMSTHQKSKNEFLGEIIENKDLREKILTQEFTSPPSKKMLSYIPQKHRDAVEAALQKVKGVNAKDSKGETQLHKAANAGNSQEVKNLLRLGADVNAKDKYGDTALHNAVNKGYDNVAKQLIAAGADVKIKNLNGSTAPDFSKTESMNQILHPKASFLNMLLRGGNSRNTEATKTR
ncbi:MAG: ankyrin repeat domain-containing protein [Rickettsiales bacterium]|nr:ankyrin repeat domain-containing protein [Rickettsiales bacterium]